MTRLSLIMEALLKYASKPLAVIGLEAALSAIDVQDSLNAQTKRPFKEDRILNVSLRDYVKSVGKMLSDYKMHGIFAYTGLLKGNRGFCEETLAEKVREKYPNAEVVVNFEYASADFYKCYGTVLVPK